MSIFKNKVVVVLSALAVAAAVALACEEVKQHDSVQGSPEDAVDTELMAYLSRARALHHEANLKEDLGDKKGAILAMERLTSQPFSRAKTPEVEEVLSDAFARRAELELGMGDINAAKTSVTRGLEHAKDATYFRGHLMEVSGLVEETRANILVDAGKTDEAKQAQERALQELEQAIEIQNHVLSGLLGDGGREGGR
jgi:tetratricopeptide (TPR) repeat protein